MAVYRDFDYDLRINGTLTVTGNTTVPSLTVNGDIITTGRVGGINLTEFKKSFDEHSHDGRYYTQTESDGRFLGILETASNSSKLDGVSSNSYVKGNWRSYETVAGDDGTDGWYTLFTVADNATTPVQCNIKAYAHTSVSFVVSAGYSYRNGTITILNSNTISSNSGFKFIKGIRVMNDGKVQIKLNGGSNVNISAQLIGNGAVPTLSSTLVKETDTTATVEDIIDPIPSGILRAKSDVYIGSNKVWHEGSLNPSSMLNKSLNNESVQNGFTINGSAFIGSTGSTGSLHIRNSSNSSVVQIAGDSSTKATGVKSYINANGDATFDGITTVNTLKVSNRDEIANLNAEMVGGINSRDLVTRQSNYEIGGTGIYSGLSVSQSGDGQQTQVTINSGIVYTASGKRFSIPTQGYIISAPSTTTNSHRIDTIYVAGPSEGNNEGLIRHKQGSYSVSPTPPSIPSDGIALADVYMGSNQGTILNAKITDKRVWRNVGHYGDTLTIYNADIKNISGKVYIGGPIEYSKFTKRITIPSGQTSVTWTHNIGVSSYAVFLSCNSPEPHIYWSNQTNSQITINLDDVCDNDVEIHAILFDCD